MNSVLNSASDRLPISNSFSSLLEICSVLSFGLCFFVSSFCQPPNVVFYVLGIVAMTPCVGSMS